MKFFYSFYIRKIKIWEKLIRNSEYFWLKQLMFYWGCCFWSLNLHKLLYIISNFWTSPWLKPLRRVNGVLRCCRKKENFIFYCLITPKIEIYPPPQVQVLIVDLYILAFHTYPSTYHIYKICFFDLPIIQLYSSHFLKTPFGYNA